MSKHDRNWDQVKWTPFEEVFLTSKNPYRGPDARTFVNSIYQVEVEGRALPPPFGNFVWISFKTRDRQPRHNWREMQRIKVEVLNLLGLDGEHTEAVEIFPNEDRLVDTCNQYHLYAFPFADFHPLTEKGLLPFGYRERLVAEGSAPGGGDRLPGKTRQTDFRPELRPPDALSFDQINALKVEDAIVGRCPICGAGFKRKPESDSEWGRVWSCLKSGHVVMEPAP